MSVLPRSFYRRETLIVAEEILGKYLVRTYNKQKLIGKIVEVEAYEGPLDPASHAYRGKTARNAVMFGDAGFAYVYFTYGNHFCLNVTTERESVAGAVLIRALEPIEGLEAMKRNRGVNDPTSLTSGPGRLTKALKIGRELNGHDLTLGQKLYLVDPGMRQPFEIMQTGRIGIREAVDRPWRFLIENNPYVSKTKPSLIQN